MSAPKQIPGAAKVLPPDRAPTGRPSIFELLDVLAGYGRWLAETEEAETSPATQAREPRQKESHAAR